MAPHHVPLAFPGTRGPQGGACGRDPFGSLHRSVRAWTRGWSPSAAGALAPASLAPWVPWVPFPRGFPPGRLWCPFPPPPPSGALGALVRPVCRSPPLASPLCPPAALGPRPPVGFAVGPCSPTVIPVLAVARAKLFAFLPQWGQLWTPAACTADFNRLKTQQFVGFFAKQVHANDRTRLPPRPHVRHDARVPRRHLSLVGSCVDR